MTANAIECLECGNAAGRGRQPKKLFCCTSCRLAFNNRRMQRGAEIYDLFCALRRERDEAKNLNLWTQICRLELAWHMEDEKTRQGRKPYMPAKRALANLLDKSSLQRGDILV